jgi:hypothetical protein
MVRRQPRLCPVEPFLLERGKPEVVRDLLVG